ncbi:MAG: nucleotidyltransferase family protein [Thermofilum sp.]|nr:nucleotidyltransferase family protein [Thermofilum sp.]
MEAVILAGGESWRMKPHVWVPKPLVELVEGVTLLEWQVSWLKKHGFSDIYVCARGFRIEELDVYWVEEREKLGTGGALKRAALQVRGDRFYALNCDDLLFEDPRNLTQRAQRGATIAVAKPKLPWGLVEVERGKVVRFIEKPVLDNALQVFANFYVSVGHYYWDKDVALSTLPEKGDVETTALPALAANGMLYAYVIKGEWVTINTYKDLLLAREVIQKTYRGIL